MASCARCRLVTKIVMKMQVMMSLLAYLSAGRNPQLPTSRSSGTCSSVYIIHYQSRYIMSRDVNINKYDCTMDQELQTELLAGSRRTLVSSSHQMAALFCVNDAMAAILKV